VRPLRTHRYPAKATPVAGDAANLTARIQSIHLNLDETTSNRNRYCEQRHVILI
jgi:hypothetical protein